MFDNLTNNNTFGAPVGSAPIPGTPVAVKPIKFTNPLTKEDLQRLQKTKTPAFSFNLTPDEMTKAKCPHRLIKEDGTAQSWMTTSDGGMTAHCAGCGATFRLQKISPEELSNAIDIVKSTIQQAKAYGFQMPEEFFTEYAMIIPLLDKLPQIYTMANINFAEIQRSLRPVTSAPNPRGNDWDVLHSVVNGTYGNSYPGAMSAASMQGATFTPGYATAPTYGVTPTYGEAHTPIYGVAPNQIDYDKLASAVASKMNQQTQSAAAQAAGNTQPFASNQAPAPNFQQPVNNK